MKHRLVVIAAAVVLAVVVLMQGRKFNHWVELADTAGIRETYGKLKSGQSECGWVARGPDNHEMVSVP
jgi:hypothetical protein